MKNDTTVSLQTIKDELAAFIAERDWEQFHKPKDVALALSIEVSEVLEHFRFKSDEEIAHLLNDSAYKQELQDELGDCLGFLVDLGRITGIDLTTAFHEKMKKNRLKYPAEQVKGKNHKYTYYQQ